MIINGATLAATQIGYRAAFQNAFVTAPIDYAKFTLEVPSTKKSEVYKWMGQLPTMKRWVDDAQFEKLEAYSWAIENAYWQAGLEVERDDIEDDALGLIMPQIGELGAEARRHPGLLVYQLINAGDTSLCYDGQYFFDTDHRDGTGAQQSNKMTGALTQANLRAMKMMFRKLQDTRGRSLNKRMTHLLVPPELEGTATDLVELETFSTGGKNPEYKTVELVVSNELTSAVKWYGFSLDSPLKPFIFQRREGPFFVAQDSPTDENAFNRRKFRYNSWYRGNAGYGLWQFAAMSTGV
jgi:phage major head subunit gpT-like protein